MFSHTPIPNLCLSHSFIHIRNDMAFLILLKKVNSLNKKWLDSYSIWISSVETAVKMIYQSVVVESFFHRDLFLCLNHSYFELDKVEWLKVAEMTWNSPENLIAQWYTFKRLRNWVKFQKSTLNLYNGQSLDLKLKVAKYYGQAIDSKGINYTAYVWVTLGRFLSIEIKNSIVTNTYNKKLKL